jgi:hypothetical protein
MIDKSKLTFNVLKKITEPILSRGIYGDVYSTEFTTSENPKLWVIFYGGDSDTEGKYTCEFPEEDIFDGIDIPYDMYEISEGVFGYDGDLSIKELTNLLSKSFRQQLV